MNLPKIMKTNESSDERGNHWMPEIPFEDLAEEVTELERKASLEEELDTLMIKCINHHYFVSLACGYSY